jgi:hypothetical protein
MPEQWQKELFDSFARVGRRGKRKPDETCRGETGISQATVYAAVQGYGEGTLEEKNAGQESNAKSKQDNGDGHTGDVQNTKGCLGRLSEDAFSHKRSGADRYTPAPPPLLTTVKHGCSRICMQLADLST